MLIKFQSEGAAPFEMLREDAILLLSLMGQRDSNEGSISGEAIPAALDSLETGLSRLERDQDSGQEPEVNEDEDKDEEPPVPAMTRAAPLKKMLNHAASNDSYVMWRPA